MLSTALELIFHAMRDLELTPAFFAKVSKPALELKEKLHLKGDAKEIMMKAAIIALATNEDEAITSKQVASFFSISNIAFLKYSRLLEDLQKEQIMRRGMSRFRGELATSYTLMPECLEAIRDNKEYTPIVYSKMTCSEVLTKINQWLSITDHASSYYGTMVKDIDYLLNQTQHLSFSRQLTELPLDTHHRVMLLIAVCFQVLRHHRCIGVMQYDDIMMDSCVCDMMCNDLDNGTDILCTLDLLENDCTDGVADKGDYVLTEHACKTLLAETHFTPRAHNAPRLEGLLKPEDITPKELYYNEREGKQMERLTAILAPEKLESVRQRLKDSGLRTGFCILLHGAQPGTGKTESVLQACRKTGHPIYQVKMSEVRSKWVGDSEKHTQAIFDNYRQLVQSSRKANTPIPVLFLNEADALMGSRRQVDDMGAVDKMNNTIQNIILQNMEDLDGILIATTNLTANFDKAMERRWLMTIHFEKPCDAVRAKIFRTMLPELSEEESLQLASEFPTFAGGQIENVNRRFKIEQVLEDLPFTMDNLRALCREEGVAVKTRQRVGF